MNVNRCRSLFLVTMVTIGLTFPARLFGQTNTFPSSGNVGIGTTMPSYTLDINPSSSNPQLHVGYSGQDSGGYLTSVLPSNLAISAGTSWNGSNWIAKSSSASIISSFNGYTNFYNTTGLTVGNVLNTSLVLTITPNGTVGINTASPNHTLGVAGSIGAESITVSSTGADYVFDPSYQLQPLSAVADYIKQNHHLPEIPPASEMKKKGLDLGEMQTKLLAKVEELTLQMIAADERIRKLERENQELQNAMSQRDIKTDSGRMRKENR